MAIRFNMLTLIFCATACLFTLVINILLYNKSLSNSFLVCASGLGLVYLLALLIENKPRIIFDNKGIRFRAFPFVFRTFTLLEWPSISSFEHFIKNSDGDEHYLIINEKWKNKRRRINLSILEFKPDLIIDKFRQYAGNNNVYEYKKNNLSKII